MAFSVSPSVIVREVDVTATIPATTAAPAAIAGVFRWGPTNERILISSENELVSRFGKPYSTTSGNTTWQNTETFFTAADYLSYSNALYVVRAEDGAATAQGTAFEALYPGELGNSIAVSYTDTSSYEDTIFDVNEAISEFGTLTFNSNILSFETTVPLDLTINAKDIIRIGNNTVGYQNLVVSTIDSAEVNVANTTTYTYDIEFENNYTLSETDIAALSIKKLWAHADIVASAPTTGNYHIVVLDNGGVITGVAGTILEVYQNVSVSQSARLFDGTTNYYKNVIANRSSWVSTTANDLGASAYEVFTSGDDGADEYGVGFGVLGLAYDLFKDTNEVDISFVLQGSSSTVLDGSGLPITANIAQYIVSNIVDYRKDCIAFLSPPKSLCVDPADSNSKLNKVVAYRNLISSSSYWFMDSGYKYRYDKYNDVYRWIPLNGDIAGLASRVEPWESPAGYKRGIVKNVVKLAFNPNKTQRDVLYTNNINPVISQVGQGIVLFGDKTGLGTPSSFDRINVRRLFITVEKAIANVAASFLFDFNDEFTQSQFKNIIEPFLRDIQGRRGIIDFRVVSDGTVNTPDVIDSNTFRGNIFIKPARSINVIELTFVAARTGVEFEELVGRQL